MLTALCLITFGLAVFPAMLFVANLREYRPPSSILPMSSRPSVSVLIPARDEESSIGQAIESVLASRGVELELIVLDDHSHDSTAAVVRSYERRDPRLRLAEAPELPEGWSGKPHACAVLARLASRPILVFLDADVRLAPDGLERMIAFLGASGADLISGFPRQITVGLSERLVIPLIHFILLGFLPVRRMRLDRSPSLAAGCGQLFVTKASSYEQAEGHTSIRSTFHDGLKLPRAYRARGMRTDLFDATDVASCRMYRNTSDLWSGLSKNATEALAAPSMIVPATILLFGGQMMPTLLLLFAPSLSRSQLTIVVPAFLATYLPRLLGVRRFRQSLPGALLHPAGIAMLLAIQWTAFVRKALGRPTTWKGRARPGHAGR